MVSISASKTPARDWPASIAEASARLREGSLTVHELTSHYIDGVRVLQKDVNAFITITADKALETASTLDRELRSGRDRGPLHGIPLVYKDNFDTAGVVTTVGSGAFRTRVPTESAAVVNRLTEAGAVMLGKANMNEFAAGPSGTNKAYGDIHNPWDLTRSAGGTSSGTAVAVSAGLCLGGTGTDTGGSIRIPASWTGVSGIRPTTGRVSMAGIFPRAPSLDCAGPIARSVTDLTILMNAMAHDDAEQGSVAARAEQFVIGSDGCLNGMRLGIVRDYTFDGVDEDVHKALNGALDSLRQLGAQIEVVPIPLLGDLLDYRRIYDILLYEFKLIFKPIFDSTVDRENVFGPIVQSDLRRSEQISADKYDRALQARGRQTEEVRTIFAEVDALITPTLPMTAPLLTTSLLEYDRARQFALPFNYLGLPSLSVPCGFGVDGLPVGMQIVADHMKEATLLRIGHAFQMVTNHHDVRPPIFWSGP